VLGWTQKGGNERQITAAIDDCRTPSGATSLWDALEQALDQSPDDAYTKPFWIVLLTDGMDSTSQGRLNSEYQYNQDGTRVRRADYVEDKVHEANTMARCQSVLLPKVQQFKAKVATRGQCLVLPILLQAGASVSARAHDEAFEIWQTFLLPQLLTECHLDEYEVTHQNQIGKTMELFLRNPSWKFFCASKMVASDNVCASKIELRGM
jgi:hypothetical protein